MSDKEETDQGEVDDDRQTHPDDDGTKPAAQLSSARLTFDHTRDINCKCNNTAKNVVKMTESTS